MTNLELCRTSASFVQTILKFRPYCEPRGVRDIPCGLQNSAGRLLLSGLILGLLAIANGCSRPANAGWQGYVEGDFLYLGPSLAGRIESVLVSKGAQVESGAELFRLERTQEQAAQREASERIRQLAARLADSQKGLRPTEITSLEARLAQAQSGAALSRLQLERTAALREQHAVAEDEFDRVRLNHASATHLVSEIEAQLATARLGSRIDVIHAAEADVDAARAALDRVEWSLDQRILKAPTAGLVYDTVYRAGEHVLAGSPVVILLPPENIKVRFFVPEAELGALKTGDRVTIAITGRSASILARITYISPKPEFTPPVLYNRDNRAKLVFLIEATPDDASVARDLHPGQPADVTR